MNNLESPLAKDALFHVWLKSVQWFWRRRFFNFVDVFTLFRNYLPSEKGGALHLNNLESPLAKDAVPCLVEIGPVILEKRFFNFVDGFTLIVIISPWKRAEPFI